MNLKPKIFSIFTGAVMLAPVMGISIARAVTPTGIQVSPTNVGVIFDNFIPTNETGEPKTIINASPGNHKQIVLSVNNLGPTTRRYQPKTTSISWYYCEKVAKNFLFFSFSPTTFSVILEHCMRELDL